MNLKPEILSGISCIFKIEFYVQNNGRDPSSAKVTASALSESKISHHVFPEDKQTHLVLKSKNIFLFFKLIGVGEHIFSLSEGIVKYK